MRNALLPVFNDFLNDDFFKPARIETSKFSLPRINIKESSDQYFIEAELPGLSKEDIDISFDKGYFTLKAELKNKKEKNEDKFHVMEFNSKSFQRSFYLGDQNIDLDKADASMDKGILSIKIPKKDEARARKITIK